MQLSLCCANNKAVDNKLVFINCPAHRQDPNERSAWPKEIKGANVSTIAKGEEIQKISAAILFCFQQPANTYSRYANFCALIQKLQSTSVISEKFTLTQEIFSFPSNATSNQIIRFHPSFLQWILHNQSLKISQEKSSGQKNTIIKLSQKGTFLQMSETSKSICHRSYTTWWLLFLYCFER